MPYLTPKTRPKMVLKGKKEAKRKYLKMEKKIRMKQKHTTPGIRWSSPTQLLIWR
jgi:hypothetical protein